MQRAERVRAILVLLAAAACPAWTLAAALTVTVTDGAGRPLTDAVVSVLLRGTPVAAAAGTTAQLGQRERQFQPRVSVVQTGTSVAFPNFDTVRHHVYSFSPIRKFELKLYAGTPVAPVVFDKPGTAVLGCNIHDRMQAWVHVVDTPIFGKTDAAGKVVLDVPAGEHLVRAWHEVLEETGVPVQLRVLVGAAATQAAVTLAVPAAGQ